jgi:mono/diheme cytochrome c family protein
MRIWIAIAVFVTSSQDCLAAPNGNPENGKVVAERWCASCHIVSTGQTSATTEAPAFETIAKRSPEEMENLEVFLAAPHAPMPPLELSRAEIRDLVAYIASLKSP